MIQEKLRELVLGALPKSAPIHFEIPKQTSHGDLSTNVALQLAKELGKPPREIAATIVARLPKNHELVEKTEIAGPGFINFFIQPDAYFRLLKNILDHPKDFGRLKLGQKKKVLLEFVSANPTGPLNIVSARAAAFGDCLANILEYAGYKPSTEFYVNDVGNQIELFAESLYARYCQALGNEAKIPEEGYHGEYLAELGRELAKKEKKKELKFFREAGLKAMLSGQKKSLANFGVHFDRWFLQSDLFKKKEIEKSLAEVKKRGFLYTLEGATYFKSTAFGDDKDRVVIKSDGELTYFASDIAYHRNKMNRKFEWLIDIFGPDHHGYIARTKASIAAFGASPDILTVLLAQQVNLLEAGEQVKMSKRAGKLVTMDQLIHEVGKDVARYFFLTRSANTHLDFDLELAKKETPENPVFYIQYAHARIASVFRKAAEKKIKFSAKKIAWGELDLPEEKTIAQFLLEYPHIIATAATELEPHRLAFYLLELAKLFQGYYSKGRSDDRYRFISDDAQRTQAKLYLLKNTQIVLKNALNLLGISAPESLSKDEN